MRLTIKLAILFYLFLMMMSETNYIFALVMFCGLLFVDIVIIPQIEWKIKKKQQK